ncbi:MAG: Jag N-terminal domain-containing protein [Oscillospiraceae bacterium]|nr:Jag N-terminal domain-containing protein [Oscillospiraceae bacterium]
MTEIFTAKTVEEAKELAAKHFGAPVSDITFEVIEEPKKGFLGFMKGEAKVRASYTSIDVPMTQPAEAAEVQAAEETTVEETAAEEAFEEMVEEAVEEITEEIPVNAEETTFEDTFEEATDDDKEEIPDVIEVAAEVIESKETEDNEMKTDAEMITGEPSEAALAKIEKAKTYLTEVLSKMGVEAELVVTAGEESAMIDIIAENNGTVIGKRGETLDALQYLTFMIANRGDREYYRVILNSANYRERRRKTLEELAAKIARNVLRSGRQTALEPMNPYERRIIHSAIAEIEGVSSKSVGEEPYRKVVISSNKPVRRRRNDRNDRGDRNDRQGNRGNRRNNDRRRNPDAPPTRINMDSMKTSFEMDYKRPKPEDDMGLNAGLYGKIEF